MSECNDCKSITLFKGEDGKTIYNGIIDPILTNVNEGDFYINTVTWEIFGPYTSGSWGAGTALIGATGATGAAGADGADGATGSTGAAGKSLVDTSFTGDSSPFKYMNNAQANVWQEVATIYFPGTTALGVTPTAIKVILHAVAKLTAGYTFDVRVRNETVPNVVATLLGQTSLTKGIFDLGALSGASLTALEGMFVLEVKINYTVGPQQNFGGLWVYSLSIL